jgi:hypothetical protein
MVTALDIVLKLVCSPAAGGVGELEGLEEVGSLRKGSLSIISRCKCCMLITLEVDNSAWFWSLDNNGILWACGCAA